MFLDKLKSQIWLDSLQRPPKGVLLLIWQNSMPIVKSQKGVVTSAVNGKKLTFNVVKLGEILGVPAVGFGVYVRWAQRGCSS